jgi:cation transport ATPase
LLVQGMTCAACAATVESKLNAIGNVSATEKATVTAPVSIPAQRLVEEIQRAGGPARRRGCDAGACRCGCQ